MSDLARAHLLALGACTPAQHRVYNLGNGTGFSNREVLAVCREVTGVDIPATEAPRRAGDPAVLVASSGPHPPRPRLEGRAGPAVDGRRRLGGGRAATG